MTSARRKSFLSMVIATIIFIFGITAGMSFAYFSDTKEATKMLTFGKLKISLNDATSSTQTITLTPNMQDAVTGKLLEDDTITLTGSIGLEADSVPAYIRVKVEIFEPATGGTETRLPAIKFISGFLSQMSEIKDGDKRWFVVGNYLYLGNRLQEGTGNDFVFDANSTNSATGATNANKVSITNNMLTSTLAGKSVKIKLVYQAIQASGALENDDLLASGVYTEDNAKIIKNSKLWDDIFLEPSEMYTTYSSGYVRGDLGSGYDEYIGGLTSAIGAKSPYGYFQPSTNNTTGNYVAFGWYPQTIMPKTVTIAEKYGKFPSENGFDCYLGSDGGLYVEKVAYPYQQTYAFSSATLPKNSTTETSTITQNATFYFKLEPIIWKILNNSTGLLYSVTELTAMCFYQDDQARTINGTTINPSNYDYSYIRAYLNGLSTYGAGGTENGVTSSYYFKGKGFLQQSFTEKQTPEQGSVWEKGSIANAGSAVDDSGDYIFILSYYDSNNTTYFSDNSKRVKYPTDYAMASGAYRDAGNLVGGRYWLRTIFSNSSTQVCFVGGSGGYGGYGVTGMNCGIVPALFLNLS